MQIINIYKNKDWFSGFIRKRLPKDKTILETAREYKMVYGCKSKEDKIKRLIELSRYSLANLIPYATRRGKKFSVHGKCWVCKENSAYCQHHIIPLKNGGDNHKSNRIFICEHCHAEIHPWLATTQIKMANQELDRAFANTVG